MSRHLLIAAAIACATALGCESTPCDKACDQLAADCAGGDVAECSGDCDDTEASCETCFNCLDAESLCEIEPAGPCASECTGCRGN